MLQSITGVYKNGSIELTEMPENIEQSQVIVIFLEAKSQKKSEQIIGISGKQLLPFAGTITASDLHSIGEAIEQDCDRIDLNKW